MLVYVAVLKDDDFSVDIVLTVQSDKNKLFDYVKDYFGISESKKYDYKSEYLGYTKFQYSEFEDDLEGYMSFNDDEKIVKVYIFCKFLNEKI